MPVRLLNDADEELLAEFLLDWEDSQLSPAPVTPEQICARRMDLLAELKRRVATLDRINRLIFDPARETGSDGTGSFTDSAPQACPELPGYQVFEQIGRGGMGVVFKAKHERLDRFVAIKTIRGGRYVSPSEIARFQGEARILARLHHPGIVQIYDVVEQEGVLCLILEYVDGQSLAEMSRQSTMPPLQAATVIRGVADTLAVVHAKEILHRDIKPGNILIGADGCVKVTDFGVAKVLTTDSRQSTSGMVLGSPSYMAPEQANGNLSHVAERADIYGIGATLYELLTARPPFAGSSFVETLSQVCGQDPTSPRQLVPSIPADLQTICLKCLEKEPSRRYATANLTMPRYRRSKKFRRPLRRTR
jgi:serine/threonine protein kinase